MANRRSGKGTKKRVSPRRRVRIRKSAKNKNRPAPPIQIHPRKRVTRRAAEVLPRQAPRHHTKRGQYIYERDLDRSPANFQPLTPISFLERAALVFPDHP